MKISVKILFSLLFLFAANVIFSQNALSFDGVDDAVDVGNPVDVQITGTAITLEAWIYPTSWTNEAWRGNIIVKEESATGGGYGYMLRAGANGTVNFNFGSGSWNELNTDPGELVLNTWQHVAATYDGVKSRVYINGVLVDSASYTASISNAPTADLNIGANISLSRYFIGKIDEVRIWDIVRSQQEIITSMNSEFCGNPGLKAYYQFNQGIANGINSTVLTLADSSGNGNDGTLSNMALLGTSSNWTDGVVLGSAGPTSSIDVQNGCSPFVWIDGNTYTSNNFTATHTIENISGCDSVITLALSLHAGSPTTATDIQFSCGGGAGYTWLDGNTYFTNNNSATFITVNTAGCDSLITLDLTVMQTQHVNDIVVSCGPYLWIDGNTYSNNNFSATHTLTNSFGCDSVIHLQLTMGTTYGTDVQIACGPYIWIDGNTYLFNTNSPTHTLVNANSNGCDSIVTLNLSFTSINNDISVVGTTITAVENNVNYQWLDCNDDYSEIVGETNQSYNATSQGSYAVIVSSANCSDTSECFTILSVKNILTDDLTTYPNPFINQLVVEGFGSITNTLVSIIDMYGKVVYNKQFDNSNSTLIIDELGFLSKGNYILKLSNDQGVKQILIVKE